MNDKTIILEDEKTNFLYQIDDKGNKIGLLFDNNGKLLNSRGEAIPIIEQRVFRIGDKVKTKDKDSWIFGYKIIRGDVIDIFEKIEKIKSKGNRKIHLDQPITHQVCVVRTNEEDREIYQSFLETNNVKPEKRIKIIEIIDKIKKIINIDINIHIPLHYFKTDSIIYDSKTHKFSQIRQITMKGYKVSRCVFYNDAKTSYDIEYVSFGYANHNFKKFKNLDKYGQRDETTNQWRIKTIEV